MQWEKSAAAVQVEVFYSLQALSRAAEATIVQSWIAVLCPELRLLFLFVLSFPVVMMLIMSWSVAGLSTTVNRIHESYSPTSQKSRCLCGIARIHSTPRSRHFLLARTQDSFLTTVRLIGTMWVLDCGGLSESCLYFVRRRRHKHIAKV
jgi:hypothetical protein